MNNENSKIEISTTTVFKGLLVLVVFWMVYVLKDVFVLILLSFILSTALSPLIDRIEIRKIPRAISVLLVYVFAGLIVYLMFLAVVPNVLTQIGSISQNRNFYIEEATEIFNNAPDPVKEGIRDLPSKIRGISVNGFLSGALGVFNGIFGFITVLVLAFYFLIEKDAIEKLIVHYFPENYKRRGTRVLKKISRNMSLWFRGQIALSLIIGFISYVGLLIIGVNYALTLAVWVAFTELIPIIGPILGGIPAVLIASTDSINKGVYVILLYVVIQALEGHIMVPQIMKKALGLSPVFIIISILIGARLFGVLGVILAVPVGSALSVILEEIHEYDKIEEAERKISN
ncbi:hypothetical protein COY62_02955 [bacterium (Candidatus Howlettbacteria) CG_4_10_14_0_8_um_filter_40_9]|nr:MAG: hypothetical protein COY62_02955 [bacterium (Candidatus Howlettbacteria) CG_4_10_14_0_8_um_filter_40_9]